MKTTFLFCLVFLFSSCIASNLNSETSENAPTMHNVFRPHDNFPGVITGFEVTADNVNVLTSPRVCLSMNGNAYWEPPAVWDEINSLPAIAISIDSKPVNNISIDILGPANVVLGSNGESIGQYPQSYEYCFEPRLEVGTHIIKVSIQALTGLGENLEWSFRVI